MEHEVHQFAAHQHKRSNDQGDEFPWGFKGRTPNAYP